MDTDLCPNCRSLRNLIVTFAIAKTAGKKKKLKRKLIRSYHCETCSAFVKSESF